MVLSIKQIQEGPLAVPDMGDLEGLLECIAHDGRSFSARLAPAFAARYELLPEPVRTMMEVHMAVFCPSKLAGTNVLTACFTPYQDRVLARFPDGTLPKRLWRVQPEVMFIGAMMDIIGTDSVAYPAYKQAWQALCFPAPTVVGSVHVEPELA